MKKLYLSTLVLFLITIIAFFSFLFLLSKQQNFNNNIPAKNNVVAKNNNDAQKTKDENKIDDNLPSKIYHVNGEIKKISKDTIFVEAIILEGKKLEFNKEKKTEIIEIKIGPNTNFSKLTFIPKEDGRGYSSVIQKIKFDDLKKEDKIEAMAGADIKGLKNFTAISIKIMPKSIQ